MDDWTSGEQLEMRKYWIDYPMDARHPLSRYRKAEYPSMLEKMAILRRNFTASNLEEIVHNGGVQASLSGFSLLLICILLAVTQSLIAQKLVTPGYLFNSDPTCREIDGRFYLFTTQDPFTTELQTDNKFFKGMYAFHALSTTDFDHWTDHGSILTSRDVTWNTGAALWDGDAGIPANGKFYAYAPFRVNSNKEANYGRFNVGVFVAEHATGPYRDVYGGPMKRLDGSPLEALSPSVVKADDGSPYLIWGSGDTEKRGVWIAKLKPSMVELAEAPRELRVPMEDACGEHEYYESPVLFKSRGRWIMTWVAYKTGKGRRCDAKGSSVRYAGSDSMFGPFDQEAPRTLIYPSAGGQESVQQGVCEYRGHSYLAYHLPYDNVAPYNDHHRQVAITSLIVNPDGSLQPVNPDRDPGVGTAGVTSLNLDAFAPRREAAEFHVRTKVEAEPSLSGEYQMKMKDGGYLRFNRMDFGSRGASAFNVEVSSEVSKLTDAFLEIRLDNPAGQIIASIAVDGGKGKTEYRLLSGKVDSRIHGVHDLCLVARGGNGNAEGYLFNITWFNFTKR
jgi:arabinoxylan arabinofuranohydrolase